MFDLDHPFFKPLWIRLLIVGVSLGWALIEFAAGAMFWGVLFGAIGVYATYKFFVNFNPRDEP